MTSAFRNFLLLAAASVIAIAAQLSWISASLTPDGYVPFGNDGFYHARRILDAVVDPSAFYEFDERIHWPTGSLLTWPWGYDYFMAALVRGGMALGLAHDPMTLLVHIPVAAVVLSLSLLLVMARTLQLGTFPTAALLMTVAVLPLTGGLHGVGMIDHHWAEYVSVLAFVAATLAWARQPGSGLRAALLGVILGVAPAIHNGLFILQAVLLAWAVLIWWRKQPMPTRQGAIFGLALVFATLLVLLPSQPFQEGRFEYYLLSWFHLYVAGCTALLMNTLGRVTCSGRGVTVLAGLALLLGAPVLAMAWQLGSFVGKSDVALQGIIEAMNLLEMSRYLGIGVLLSYYSVFILLLPLIWLACWAGVWRTTDRRRAFVFVYGLLALPILLMQFRFHYYASTALFLLLALALDRALLRWSAVWMKWAAAVALALALYPSASHTFKSLHAPGGETYYRFTAAMAPTFAAACRQDPAVVLARPNDGHHLRFHTDCPVIANNFLLTPQHFEAFHRVNRLFELSPAELLEAEPELGYVFVRVRSALVQTEKGTQFVSRDDARVITSPLDDALLWGDPADLPPEFELIGELPGPLDYPLVRVYRINRQAIQSPAS